MLPTTNHQTCHEFEVINKSARTRYNIHVFRIIYNIILSGTYYDFLLPGTYRILGINQVRALCVGCVLISAYKILVT